MWRVLLGWTSHLSFVMVRGHAPGARVTVWMRTSVSSEWKVLPLSVAPGTLLRCSSSFPICCCCCLPTPMALASGGSPMFPLVVHQPASPSIWPAVHSLRRGLSTNQGRQCCSGHPSVVVQPFVAIVQSSCLMFESLRQPLSQVYRSLTV